MNETETIMARYIGGSKNGTREPARLVDGEGPERDGRPYTKIAHFHGKQMDDYRLVEYDDDGTIVYEHAEARA